MEIEGFLLFYKKQGISSYDVIRFLKSVFKIKKIGHGGSLDFLAEGLLIIGLNKKYTKKLIDFLKNSEKEYLAELILGYTSKTYDREGPILKIENFKKPNLNLIKKIIEKNFIGLINQTPPIYSAIKIKGEPAYKLARLKKDVNLKSRKVFIKNIEILNYKFPKLFLKIITGSGVYIRSLVNDLGQKLKCGAYLNNLLRTRINDYCLKEALDVNDFKNNNIALEGKIFGKVQNVGFRYFLKQNAEILNLKGWVKNEENYVLFFVVGEINNVLKFLALAKKGPIFSQVTDTFFIFKKSLKQFNNFSILK